MFYVRSGDDGQAVNSLKAEMKVELDTELEAP